MSTIFTIPAGVFLILWGLTWKPQPKTKKDLKAEQALLADGTDADTDIKMSDLTPKQMRNYLRRIFMRASLFIMGTAGIIVGLVEDAGNIKHWEAFGFFLALYGMLLLALQRSDIHSRLIVLFSLGFVGLIIWRYADYREYSSENVWGLLAAVALNGVFWFLIGRRFPPTSDTIKVIGMEE